MVAGITSGCRGIQVMPMPKPPLVRLADLTARHIWDVWNKAQTALGLLDEEAFTPHGLRHEFCSRLGDRGVAAQAIQKLAGHANLSTSQRYIHLSPVSLESAIRALEPL